MRYKPVGLLHDCAACTQRAMKACAAAARGECCTDDHRVLVLDPDVHDRWHNEQNAHADPRQAALFG